MAAKSFLRLTHFKAFLSRGKASSLCESNTLLLSCIGLTNTKFLHSCRPLLKKEEVGITIEKSGKEMNLKGKEGDSILDVVVNNNVDLGGYGFQITYPQQDQQPILILAETRILFDGACEGTLSCSTCHVILNYDDYSKIPDRASDEELDMLDLAPDVCGTSRLGCQVYLCKKIEGIRLKVPSVIKDQRDIAGESKVKT